MSNKLKTQLVVAACIAVLVMLAGPFSAAAQDPVVRTCSVTNTTNATWTVTLLLESGDDTPGVDVAAGETIEVTTTDSCYYSIRAIGDDSVGGSNQNFCLNGTRVTPGNQGSDDCELVCDDSAMEIWETGSRRKKRGIRPAS